MKAGQFAPLNATNDELLRPPSIRSGKLTKNKHHTSTSVEAQRSYRTSEKNVGFSGTVEMYDDQGVFYELAESEVHQNKEEDEPERQVRLQGMIKPEVLNKLDIKSHFKAFDYREEANRIEREKEQRKEAAESKTQVGAVKRLIQRVSSLSVGDQALRARSTRPANDNNMRRSLSQRGLTTVDKLQKETDDYENHTTHSILKKKNTSVVVGVSSCSSDCGHLEGAKLPMHMTKSKTTVSRPKKPISGLILHDVVKEDTLEDVTSPLKTDQKAKLGNKLTPQTGLEQQDHYFAYVTATHANSIPNSQTKEATVLENKKTPMNAIVTIKPTPNTKTSVEPGSIAKKNSGQTQPQVMRKMISIKENQYNRRQVMDAWKTTGVMPQAPAKPEVRSPKEQTAQAKRKLIKGKKSSDSMQAGQVPFELPIDSVKKTEKLPPRPNLHQRQAEARIKQLYVTEPKTPSSPKSPKKSNKPKAKPHPDLLQDFMNPMHVTLDQIERLEPPMTNRIPTERQTDRQRHQQQKQQASSLSVSRSQVYNQRQVKGPANEEQGNRDKQSNRMRKLHIDTGCRYQNSLSRQVEDNFDISPEFRNKGKRKKNKLQSKAGNQTARVGALLSTQQNPYPTVPGDAQSPISPPNTGDVGRNRKRHALSQADKLALMTSAQTTKSAGAAGIFFKLPTSKSNKSSERYEDIRAQLVYTGQLSTGFPRVNVNTILKLPSIDRKAAKDHKISKKKQLEVTQQAHGNQRQKLPVGSRSYRQTYDMASFKQP